MTSLTRKIWGREFELPVRFEDLDQQGITDGQWNAYGKMISSWTALDGSLSQLKEYCLKSDGSMIENGNISNIFRYVIPKYLFVPEEDAVRTVALMCDYRFDPEHGIAIVFQNEKLAEIGMQDVVL